MKTLLIVGAGGFARETAQAVRAINAVHPTWELAGFLDDDQALQGASFGGTPVVGLIDSAVDSDAAVVVCTGRPDNYFSRRRIVERLGLPADRYATVVHPSCAVSADTSIGSGSVLLAGVVTTAAVEIGDHVAVMPQAVITHDDVIGDYATVASGVRLGGGVDVGTGAYIGSGALVREAISVGEWSLIGMGSVVLSPVPDHEVWVGAPARRLRDVVLPRDWQVSLTHPGLLATTNARKS
jgi:sugar O-acyltransferase (sialic acid O-acetyltransferase NeuD family)